MKKMILFLLAFVTMGEAAKAQTISVADVEALPGETVAFSVDLTGGKDTKYTAFQFDVQFPATGFTTTGDYTVSPLWTGASATVGSVDASGLATVPFASANEIPGTDVEGLVSVSFKVDEGVAEGNYDVTLKNIFLAYNTSDKDYPDDVTFQVKVVAAHSVELDEESTVAPVAATGVNVHVVRTIKAGSWSTICLPFAMSEAQTKAAFGDDVLLKDFTSWSSEEDGEGNVVKLTIGFTDVTAMEANHPYLIKVSSAVSEFSVEGVDIDPAAEPVKQVGTKKKDKGYFYGNYVAETAVPEYCLFVSNDKFYYSTGATKMKAFRGYFDLYDVLTSVEEASARIMIGDETTGIKAIENSQLTIDNYYNLAGQKVENPKKGLYITNNKKVIIK